jgi:hypothetical protein
MIEIEFSSYDLNSPRDRRALLLKIPPNREVVRKYHPELLDLFRREMSYRTGDDLAEGDDECDYFEHLYWCGLLLYLVGDPADVAVMWEAKHINMDTGCGFDGQFLVGAGVEETIKYLEERGQKAPADYLKELKASKELDDLQGWERFRIHYFYPHNPLQETPAS